MSVVGGPRGRGRRLITPLRSATALALLVALAAVVVPGSGGRALGWAVIFLVLMAPLARVAFLVVRWAQLADRHFSVLAGLLVVEVGAAAGIAAWG